MAHNHCIIMFVKAPEKGMVKSRLASSVGDEAALILYRCFVKDLMGMMVRTGHPYVICFHPPDSRDKIVQWLGNAHVLLPQIGDNLGERMKNAFLEVFSKGYRNVILIGSDSPDLPGLLIDEAFSSLKDQGHGAVIGPSLDGGYYLIGFRADTFLPTVFEGIPWSSPDVFLRTLHILQKEGLLIHTLPQWRDIDTPDDLRKLYVNNGDSTFAESVTMRYIAKHRCHLIRTDGGGHVSYE